MDTIYLENNGHRPWWRDGNREYNKLISYYQYYRYNIGTCSNIIIIFCTGTHRCRTRVSRAPSRAGTASLSTTVWSCACDYTYPGMCRARTPSPIPSYGLDGRPCPWPRPGTPPNHVCNRGGNNMLLKTGGGVGAKANGPTTNT